MFINPWHLHKGDDSRFVCLCACVCHRASCYIPRSNSGSSILNYVTSKPSSTSLAVPVTNTTTVLDSTFKNGIMSEYTLTHGSVQSNSASQSVGTVMPAISSENVSRSTHAFQSGVFSVSGGARTVVLDPSSEFISHKTNGFQSEVSLVSGRERFGTTDRFLWIFLL